MVLCIVCIMVLFAVLVLVYTHLFYNPFKDKNVIVVGNSKELLDDEMGSVIDGYDMIIRLNHFKIEGYEKYTGTRTDGIHMNYILTPREVIHNVLDTNTIKWMGTRDKSRFCSKVGMSRFDKRVFQYDTKTLPCRSPTSGTAVLADIMKYCNRPVTIIGVGGYSEPGYYYKETQKVLDHNWKNSQDRHCLEVEKVFLDNLIESGKVRKLGRRQSNIK